LAGLFGHLERVLTVDFFLVACRLCTHDRNNSRSESSATRNAAFGLNVLLDHLLHDIAQNAGW
jgi:hypothetical protein